MPRILLYIALLLVALTLLPLGAVYRSRQAGKAQPRIQVVPDMDSQVKYKSQTVNGFFADGVTMREPVPGTVAFGAEELDDSFYTGMIPGLADTVYVAEFPLEPTLDTRRRGQERFVIYCAPCHGEDGRGGGPVHLRAAALGEGTWTPPTDLTGETVRNRPVGHLFQTIRTGIRNMPAYGSQVPTADRWGIAAHVRSLAPDLEGE